MTTNKALTGIAVVAGILTLALLSASPAWAAGVRGRSGGWQGPDRGNWSWRGGDQGNPWRHSRSDNDFGAVFGAPPYGYGYDYYPGPHPYTQAACTVAYNQGFSDAERGVPPQPYLSGCASSYSKGYRDLRDRGRYDPYRPYSLYW